jgi:hypothetical protein
MTPHPTDTPQASTKLLGQTAGGPGWRVLNEPASVRFHPWGSPLELSWRGNPWQVIRQPMWWSGPGSWWEPDPTSLGGHSNLITTHFWRFHAQTGPVSPVLEFEISNDPRRDTWRLHQVRGVEEY